MLIQAIPTLGPFMGHTNKVSGGVVGNVPPPPVELKKTIFPLDASYVFTLIV